MLDDKVNCLTTHLLWRWFCFCQGRSHEGSECIVKTDHREVVGDAQAALISACRTPDADKSLPTTSAVG